MGQIMNKKIILSIFFLSCFLFLQAEEALIPEHKEWLDLVSPIITDIERDVFLQLKNSQERNKFIQTFWKKHDTLPDTEENEFQKEYMERVRFADFTFGRETSKKGHMTERGYYYLLLGPPQDRQIYATQADLNPLELWFYKGDPKYGLASYFHLIFYQPQNIGEYRLYSPGIEGPERLISPTTHSRSVTRAQAYQIIKNISGELAGASLSYLPGDTPQGGGSFSSDTILASIHSLPEKKFKDSYARNFLYYKDFVETEYSHNFTDSTSLVKVFENGGQFFLNWALEPSRINFALYEDKYYSAFQLILRIEDNQGNLVLEKEEEIPVTVSPENYKKHERQLFAIQDVLPVIPGKYKFIFFLQNKTAKDFTSFQKNIIVPEKDGNLSFSPLLLYHAKKNLGDSQKNRLKAFAFEKNQYIVNTQNNFLPEEKLGVFCQIYNLDSPASKSIQLEVLPVNSEEPVQKMQKSLNEVINPTGTNIDMGEIPLSGLKPGYFKISLSLVDEKGEKTLTAKENFVLLSRPYPVIPWTFSKLHNAFPNPEFLFLLASQHFMTREYDRAKNLLERSLSFKDDPQTRALLARTLFGLAKYQEAITTALPAFEKTRDREIAKVIAAGYAALKDWTSALNYLEQLLAQASEVSVLNLAAECYLNLNHPEKALPLLQKSLELYPGQKYIKDLEEKTKNKIK
jgi:GWxTD domain-containing protein